MGLVADAARGAIADKVAGPLGMSTEEAALSILDLTTESMVNAIEDTTVKQGIDPADTVIIGGGDHVWVRNGGAWSSVNGAESLTRSKSGLHYPR